MNSKIEHPASRLVSNLVGPGMPERLRAGIFALLGAATAAGLGLVLLFAQSGLPTVSLGPIEGPIAGKVGLYGGVSLGGGGGGSSTPTSGAEGGSVATADAETPVALDPASGGAPTIGGAPTAGPRGGSESGANQVKGGTGSSQPGTPAPASPVREPGSTTEPAAPAPEPAPVAVPVSQPAPAPEPPAVPAGEEPPLEELPGVEEPPLEEGEENPIVEEESEEPLYPSGDPGAVPLPE